MHALTVCKFLAEAFAVRHVVRSDLKRALGGSATEQAGAALALSASPSPQAAALLDSVPELKQAIAQRDLTWNNVLEQEATS